MGEMNRSAEEFMQGLQYVAEAICVGRKRVPGAECVKK